MKPEKCREHDLWDCPECKNLKEESAVALSDGLDPSPVMVGIQEERLLRALKHLQEAQYPNVQFTGLMENMADEAISNMKISIYDAIETLREGNEDYFKLKGV